MWLRWIGIPFPRAIPTSVSDGKTFKASGRWRGGEDDGVGVELVLIGFVFVWFFFGGIISRFFSRVSSVFYGFGR